MNVMIYNNAQAIKELQGAVNDLAATIGALQTRLTSIDNGPKLYIGAGSPQGAVTAVPGSIYTNSTTKETASKITGTDENGWGVQA